MRDYFYKRFPSQAARLKFQRPNDIVRDCIMHDSDVAFFGGENWGNVAEDLATVPVPDRSRFILSLFMVILTDQALYTYFHNYYHAWRSKTNFPKFGWSGLGPHNENPFKILWAPEREQIIAGNELTGILAFVPDFMKFCVSESTSYFNKHLPTIEMGAYFDAIRHDNSYSFNEGAIVPRVKAELDCLTANLKAKPAVSDFPEQKNLNLGN